MSYWEKVREELAKAATGGWEVLKSGAKKAGTKSSELAKVSKLKYDAHSKHKTAEKLFTELGGKVYDMAKPPYENPLCDAKLLELIEEIKGIEAEASALEEEAAQIKTKEKNKTGSTTEPTIGSTPNPAPEPKTEAGERSEKTKKSSK